MGTSKVKVFAKDSTMPREPDKVTTIQDGRPRAGLPHKV